ncbi:hypothetical protein H4S08_004134 [Coemansia sp. RSA 1365]|nr:hypothetical protein H4S08_004134 [Coemansia sp. RSA 1365]
MDSSHENNMLAALTVKPQVMDFCWRHAVMEDDFLLPLTVRDITINIAMAIFFIRTDPTQAVSNASTPVDLLMAVCHIDDPSEVLRGVNGFGYSNNMGFHLNVVRVYAASAKEKPFTVLTRTFCQVHPLGQFRTGQLQTTRRPHHLPLVLTMAVHSTDQVALNLASLLQVTANGSKFINKTPKYPTKATGPNLTN